MSNTRMNSQSPGRRFQRITPAVMALVAVCACGVFAADLPAPQGSPQSGSSRASHSALDASQVPERIPTWIAVLRQRGQARIDHAYSLAARGALFSAQQELLEVLRMVSQAIDTQNGTNQHSAALAAALQTLDEANDFQPSNVVGTRELDLTTIVSRHQSRIVRPDEAATMTSLMVLQRYYSFVQNNLVDSAHGDPIAAEAMYGLGRLQLLLDGNNATVAFSEQRMLLFYMSAVSTDPKHYLAANELGVLLTRLGQFQYAQKALEQSASSRAEAENCRNLLAVYEHNGETERADQLRRHCGAHLNAASRSATSSRQGVPEVAWVDAEVFTTSGPAGELEGSAMSQLAPADKAGSGTTTQPAQRPEADPAHPVRRWFGRVKDTVKPN